MQGMTGDRVRMRIHIGESDRFEGKPLYQHIVDLLRVRQYAGATVYRGMTGFGASSRIHADQFLELSSDLPVVIDCVDTEERINEILPAIDAMLGGGMITLEPVTVRVYRPNRVPERGTLSKIA